MTDMLTGALILASLIWLVVCGRRGPTVGLWLLLGLLAVAGPAQADPVNLIVNGNFSAGNTGFSTDFGYSPIPCSVTPDCTGEYAVFGDASTWWNGGGGQGYVPSIDHTSLLNPTATSNMLLINDFKTPNHVVFQSMPFQLFSGRTYTGGGWFTSILPFTDPLFLTETFRTQLVFGPTVVNVGDTPTFNGPLAGTWNPLTFTYTPGVDQMGTLRVLALTGQQMGVDAGVDDLFLYAPETLTATPEPASLLLLGTGLCALAYRARRRAA